MIYLSIWSANYYITYFTTPAMSVMVVDTIVDQRDVSLYLSTTNSSSIRIPFSALQLRAISSGT